MIPLCNLIKMLCCLYPAYEKVFFELYYISIVCLFQYVLTAINIHLFYLFIYKLEMKVMRAVSQEITRNEVKRIVLVLGNDIIQTENYQK
jgi:hypothetical protein